MNKEDLKKLKKLVFNNLLTQEDLRLLENNGMGIRVPLTPVAKIEETDFSPLIIHDADRMASVYALFYCIENAVRSLISERLSERHGAGWWSSCVPTNVKKAAESLKDKETKNKYHAPRSSDMVGYTLFGNLSQIIINKWEDFSDLFPDQHWVSSRLNDLELLRNIIMHTGLLPEIEIKRIESLARDWVRQVG
jgi:energy-converting hydrogenase A subunit M